MTAIREDVAVLLHEGLSNAEVSRRTGLHPIKVGDSRQALGLPDYRDMQPGWVAPPSHREHGTRTKYVQEKCRCSLCKRANREEEQKRSRLKAYGRWKPFVDSGPVRDHIRYLQSCGMGLRVIASAAGVNRKQLQYVLNGRAKSRGHKPQQLIRPELAAAVLAVRPSLDSIAAGQVIPATGTTRRLQALAAAGWPQMHLAPEMGCTPTTVGVLMTATSVTAATARLVRDLYERLWNVDPLSRGVTPAGFARAKQRAQKSGWAPIGAWDDDRIDDPTAFPDWTGQCGTAGGYRAHGSHGIPTCDPCRKAYTAHRREQRERRVRSTIQP